MSCIAARQLRRHEALTASSHAAATGYDFFPRRADAITSGFPDSGHVTE
jgi:hypothetical protein